MERVTFATSAGTFHSLASTRGDRRLVFLHGFPDHPPTARSFFDELETRGLRVLAPWLRGYAPSPLAGPFDVGTLAADVAALIDRWSPDEPVHLVGHDWGAVITYALCNLVPTRIARAVTLAVPHPLTFLRQLRSPAQLRASWYMGLFQLPGSERIVRARDFALIDRLWRRWSPGFRLSADERRALHDGLAASQLRPLEYYRAMRRTAASRSELRRAARPISTPLLALHGANDGCVLPPRLDDSRYFNGPYERSILLGVGHFLHLEQPAVIAERVAAWLRG